ncbi:HlyD family type I secretion periplasmic adaptor subunit [Microvirga tunisiensis]|uniref:Membrane fusion protein (MFP) family protein n=1 Tax=Pannonibacter tanglangensis TaxID=2750084 RepID=A0A7X5F342_9HYPH|nr:HlyD family type I secretion periplasmic adaptor subunit [Pannonibacter sp. XCT-53]NBN77619.1 HlyD family type I secretion periplasmic adaptor subunit [Pannonibacter sp. XCT-53]
MTNDNMANDKIDKKFSTRPFVIAGYVTILMSFGVLGGWAMTAPLDSAVIAHGVLSVESSRRVVQHLEGGIVKEILVKDADRVKKDQVLIRLSPVQAQANVSMISTRLEIARAEEARLLAERANAKEVTFPEDLMQSDDPRVKFALQGQRNLFSDRVSVRDSQIKILESKIEQLRQQASGLELQRDSALTEVKLIEDEVSRLRDGEGKGVVSANRLSAFQREAAQLEGGYGRLITDIARVNEGVGETELEIVRIRQSFSERAATELKEVRTQIADLEERMVVASDILDRTEIRSEVDGVVQNLSIHTVGGVIRPGDAVMEIVPLGDRIVINAQVRPIDIDVVHAGLNAEVKLSAFANRYLPTLFGEVEYVSPDVIERRGTNMEPYYLARVVVPESSIPAEMIDKLAPGMPAEVVVPTGERTMAEYLISPLRDAVRNSMREE